MQNKELNAVRALQGITSKIYDNNAFLNLENYKAYDKQYIMYTLLAFLVVYKILILSSFFFAWTEWYLDPQYWNTSTNNQINVYSPFHGHKNYYGWNYFFQGFLIMHGVTGVLLFVVCLIPLISKKGNYIHRFFGRLFVSLWIIHLLNGLINSHHILITRGLNPHNYPDVETVGFPLYTFVQFGFVAALIIDFLAHGIAALHYKNQPPGRFIRLIMLAFSACSLIYGIITVTWAILHLTFIISPETPRTTEFAVIYIIQIPAYTYLIIKNMRYWWFASPRKWLHGWLTEHQRNLMFCVQATLYTGMANITMKYAFWLTPILFGSIDITFFVWLIVKEGRIRKRIIKSRITLAMLSLLKKKDRTPNVEPDYFSSADTTWLFNVMDKDGDEDISREEIQLIFRENNIEISQELLDEIFQRLDKDGNQSISMSEWGAFLLTHMSDHISEDEKIYYAFMVLDKNGDGKISWDEFAEVLNYDQNTLTKKDIDNILYVGDLNNDGFIDAYEFKKLLQSSK